MIEGKYYFSIKSQFKLLKYSKRFWVEIPNTPRKKQKINKCIKVKPIEHFI